jgi:hypothetical protein
MTPDDALARELESLRPRPPSPELRRRLGRRLSWPGRGRLWGALAMAAAVAGAAVGLVLHRWSAPPVGLPQPVAALPPPSVFAYQQAFARSSADLDALLDEQAVRTAQNVTPLRAGVVPNLLAVKGTRE